MKLPDTIEAMVFHQKGQPLVHTILPMPAPGPGAVLVKVIACGVCRTDLHIIDGEVKWPKPDLIPGHEIIGTVVKTGTGTCHLQEGDQVGIPWLGATCGNCKYCATGRENLCEQAGFTGYTIDGGYATFTVAKEQFCFKLPEPYANAHGAPLMCAGLIGFRSYKKVPEVARKLGIYGFGAAAHILAQIAVSEGKEIYAFTAPGDSDSQEFARKLGAVWSGDSLQKPPRSLDAAIIFASSGALVLKALTDVDKGGTVVCGGIHMSDIPSFPYELLWGERTLCSVANLTRSDGDHFLGLLARTPVRTTIQAFTLQQANEALEALRQGKIHGAAVLVMPT